MARVEALTCFWARLGAHGKCPYSPSVPGLFLWGWVQQHPAFLPRDAGEGRTLARPHRTAPHHGARAHARLAPGKWPGVGEREEAWKVPLVSRAQGWSARRRRAAGAYGDRIRPPTGCSRPCPRAACSGERARPRREGGCRPRRECRRPPGEGGGTEGRGSRWAGRAVCAAAGAFKPGLAGSHGAFAAREPTGCISSRLPLHPAFPDLATPDSVPPSRAMPRYELALILKAMRRVSDLPSDRVPARARPAASRPSQPRVPCLRDTGTPRAARGRSREQRGRAWVGRSARPRARGRRVGVCPRVCAVAGGGVPNTQRARGRGGPRTPALRSPMEGLREDTRARTQAGPALRPRVEKLLVVPIACPQRPRSVQPSTKARQCRLCTPRTCHRCHAKKKNLLTFLFLTPAKILLRVPLAQFYSSKLWPCLCFPKTCLPPAFD